MYLPGQAIRRVKKDEALRCSKCADYAIVERCTEADSFGYESDVYCFIHDPGKPKDVSGFCHFCHKLKPDIRDFRDPEEGNSGSIYPTCRDCRRRISDAFTNQE